MNKKKSDYAENATQVNSVNSRILGRCVEISDSHLYLRNQSEFFQIERTQLRSFSGNEIKAGDIIEINNNTVRLLTPNRKGDQNSGTRSEWMNRILHPRKLRALAIRAQVEEGIREFFKSRDFIETRTPLLVPCPGMEPHIRPFKVTSASGASLGYLPTSPEFAMKRLLVGGLERIFQICSAFREEPRSTTHSPEFTILEWYRSYAGNEDIMRDTEELFASIATRLRGEPVIEYQGRKISVAPPWPRLRVRDLFSEILKIDLVHASTAEDLARECRRLGLAADLEREDWDDLYFKLWLNEIEPRLPSDRAVFVTRYPASQAALSVIDADPDGSRWARRFEAYAGGLELGNAFEELTDPEEQRTRFIKDMNLRERIYGAEFPKTPLDEGFLDALTEGLPPSGGIAMGVDRMVMLFADEPEISFTQWLGY